MYESTSHMEKMFTTCPHYTTVASRQVYMGAGRPAISMIQRIGERLCPSTNVMDVMAALCRDANALMNDQQLQSQQQHQQLVITAQ